MPQSGGVQGQQAGHREEVGKEVLLEIRSHLQHLNTCSQNVFFRDRPGLRALSPDERAKHSHGTAFGDAPLGYMVSKPSAGITVHQRCLEYASGEHFLCFQFSTYRAVHKNIPYLQSRPWCLTRR